MNHPGIPARRRLIVLLHKSLMASSVMILCRFPCCFFLFNAARVEQHDAVFQTEHQREKEQCKQKTDGGVLLQQRDEGDDVHGVSADYSPGTVASMMFRNEKGRPEGRPFHPPLRESVTA